MWDFQRLSMSESKKIPISDISATIIFVILAEHVYQILKICNGGRISHISTNIRGFVEYSILIGQL